MMNESGTTSPTAKAPRERRPLSACLPVCFSSSTHPFDVLDDEDDAYVKAPYSPIKDRCRNLISKIGGGRRRRAASADFSYDAYSYELNFEDDTTRADDGLLRWRMLSSSPGSLTPPEKPTTSLDALDGAVEEDGGNRRWRRSVPEEKKSPNCGKIMSRMGLCGRNRHSSTSVDFSYEPSTYALNFEDDSSKVDELGTFLARLPHSPSAEKSKLLSAAPGNCSALRPHIAAFS